MSENDLHNIQNELQERWRYPYRWHRKQSDLWDKHSNFIYSINKWNVLLAEIENKKRNFEKIEQEQFFNYSINRWYNFQSAMALEAVFTNIDGVEAYVNPRDRLVDFNLFGINFDHKTSVFPKNFPNTITSARKNPRKLISWLYMNQSQQQRKHLKNRLFLVVFSADGQHWKLKAEILWLKEIIENYVATFDARHLEQFELEAGVTTYSDIIWAVK